MMGRTLKCLFNGGREICKSINTHHSPFGGWGALNSMAFYSIYLLILWALLVAVKPTRKFTLAMTPWILFGCSYDWMRLLPNYEVNPIDLEGIYNAEKSLFGITTATGTLIPGEYFNIHNAAWADLLAGFFYLCWVPVPLGYALYLWAKGRSKACARFSIAFLWINLFGFALYYVHPAAPPWYVLKYGFEARFDTPGSVAGLIRFDNMMPFPVFGNIYSGNSNVFAAVPSLHSAYVLVAAIYAVINKSSKITALCFFVITAGIWWTAVYTCHHYVIDVLLGILTAFVGVAILELGFLRVSFIKKAFDRYVQMI